MLISISYAKTIYIQHWQNRNQFKEEEYKAKKRRYELGLEKSTDVLDSQKTLADVRKSEIDAIRDYQIALIDLAKAEGTIFSAANIEWEPVVQED